MGDFDDRTSRHQRAVKLLGRLLILCAFLAAALIGSTGNAHAIECRSEKGAGYPWAWRQIDGKRCWYKGKAGMDKKLLHWVEGSRVPSAPKPTMIEHHAERERLLHSYWPLLPPADVFDDRFEAARAKRL